MMLKTKNYTLSPNDYFKIIAKNRIKRFWWVYLSCFFLAIINLQNFGEENLSTFIVLSGFIAPFLIFGHLFFWVKSQKGHLALGERKMIFYPDKIAIVFKNNAKTELDWEHILQVKAQADCWLLYIIKNQFFYLPFSSLHSPGDMEQFKSLIKEKVTGCKN